MVTRVLNSQNVDVLPACSSPKKRCEEEVVSDWVAIKGGKIVRTHKMVDADAALSAALVMELFPNVKLDFKPPSFRTDELNVLAVDMLNGNNAIKGLKDGSAFGFLVESFGRRNPIVRKCLRKWATQLNLTDSGKKCHDRVVFADLIRSWREIGLNDMTIVNRVREIIRGKLKKKRSSLKTAKKSTKVPISESVGISVAGRISRFVIFKRGAKAVVQQSDCGMAIHLSREVMEGGHNLNEIKSLLPPSWFVHPNGFLAAFGGPKDPRNPNDSGIRIEELHEIVAKWLKELE